MRTNWSLVLFAFGGGCAFGVAATLGVQQVLRDGPGGRPVRDETHDVSVALPQDRSLLHRKEQLPPPSADTDASLPADQSTVADEEARRHEQESRLRRFIAAIDLASESKDLKMFDEALRGLLGVKDVRAHAKLMDLIADDDFDFPRSGHALWCGTASTLHESPVPGWAAAARARYERDGRMPGRSWDAHAWLQLVAAHADAADLKWVADQYDTAPERRSEAIAALGMAEPKLAREAILREIRRQPIRDGLWRAIQNLAKQSPVDAFVPLDEIVRSDPPYSDFERADVLREWVRCAPADRLAEVRARVHTMAASGVESPLMITPVQAFADRGESVSDFASIIAAPGRELRRLVDEEQRADGTGPFYAIEYHRVAHTPENLAALEYAIQQLGAENTRGCQNIVANIREQFTWK